MLIFFGTICMKANSQNENTMVELRDTIEINTTIAAVMNDHSRHLLTEIPS